jgi:hypothetical protein
MTVRRAINVIAIGFFILVGAGAAAEAGKGVVAELMAAVALICGFVGWRILVAARKQSSS